LLANGHSAQSPSPDDTTAKHQQTAATLESALPTTGAPQPPAPTIVADPTEPHTATTATTTTTTTTTTAATAASTTSTAIAPEAKSDPTIDDESSIIIDIQTIDPPATAALTNVASDSAVDTDAATDSTNDETPIDIMEIDSGTLATDIVTAPSSSSDSNSLDTLAAHATNQPLEYSSTAVAPTKCSLDIRCTMIKSLNLQHQRLCRIPDSIVYLTNLTSLNLASTAIKSLPPEVCSRQMQDSITWLKLTD
jgi:Leucine-rich repeat (LRR) protein